MSCTGICGRFKASKPKTGSRYQAGQKRCNPCNIFIETDGFFALAAIRDYDQILIIQNTKRSFWMYNGFRVLN